ncbi:hypothetical protein [Streptomyces sp. NBC_00401]|uniref:hypothetical protein n=1 Tax=Streptomyces sp. NBC_00401 TaxID=2975738 RepID=UPI00224D6782|nr:hypothetical protein [Streptomyces sp. NBC_00401]MCX5085412.1 hypothetical protein [Streptomyces sp. NBC_00401]
MQQLYVVGFEVKVADGYSGPTAFERLLTHMLQHVSPETSGLAISSLTNGKGERTVPGYGPGRPDKQVSWFPAGVESGPRGVQLEIEEDLPRGGRFVCQLTACESDGATGFRVVMGRKTDGMLAPATVEDLRPPRALQTIMRDPELRCTDGQDRITSSVTHALTAQVPSIREHLDASTRRLPTLVVSSIRTMGVPAAFARKAARRLAGLAHVVVVSGWLAFDSLNATLERSLLPRDGARLYWPMSDARNPWWGPNELFGDHDALLGKLTRLLTPLSVVARERDRLWDAVRSAETDAVLEALAGTESDQIGQLKEKLEKESRFSLELLHRNDGLESQVAALGIQIANLEAQLETAAVPSVAEPAMEQTHTVSNPVDFSADWGRWTEESGGALVFTRNAKSEWQKRPYQHPEQMREALDTLAELALEWRKQRGKVGTSLVSWIGDRTPLTYAPSDEPLRRAKKHEFKFEGRVWDRQSHIKLADYTSPERVGRIYFAIDSSAHRWIVDHVGLKLYGL